jgi:hypothetical protein
LKRSKRKLANSPCLVALLPHSKNNNNTINNMPLGMMAKDSIQDFTLLGNEAEDRLTEIPHDKADENAVAADDTKGGDGLEAVAKMELFSTSRQQLALSSTSDDATTSSAGGDSCCSAASPANPQQAANEEEEEGMMMKSRTPSLLPSQQEPQLQQNQQQQQQQYAGFKSDYWSQQYYNNSNKHKPNSLQNMKNNNSTAYGAYDSSYFYDPYATTSTSASGLGNAQRAAGSSNNSSNIYLLGRNPQEQQVLTLFRCLLPCLFPWQQGPPPTSHHDAGLPLTKETQEAPEASDQQEEEDETAATREQVNGDSESGAAAVVVDDAEEVASNASETLGEKLSDRERQAVLARLRLAQPEVEDETAKAGIEKSSGEIDSSNGGVGSNDHKNTAAANSSSKVQNSSSTNSQGLLSEVPPPKPVKGILKRRTTLAKGNQDAQIAAAAAAGAVAASSTPSVGSDGTGDGGGGSKNKTPPGGPRRSLFPQYSYDSYGPPGGTSGDLGDMASSAGGGLLQQRLTKRHATFAPMARVMTVKSKNDMTADEKGDIWWVKSDYEDFRKAGRIISRAMVEGGSEIWLAFSRSCRAAAKKKKMEEQAKRSKASHGTNEKVCSDVNEDDDDDEGKDVLALSCDNWWHEFGHSRRGLEHVVSIEEGRQRQQNVRNAIQAVLEEQARQKLYRRLVDAEKLRKISLQYTSWARDLALASGSSDADAVQSSFADSRKSREFYLSELITNNNSSSSSSISSSVAAKSTSAANTSSTTTATAVTIPDFMRASSLQESPAVRQTIAAPTADLLDANTAAQIRYRRKMTKDAVADKKAATLTCEEPVHDGPLSSVIVSSSSGSNIDDVSSSSSSKAESMAHRAAGFSAEGDAKISAAAVLSGMGAVPQSSSGAISTAC